MIQSLVLFLVLAAAPADGVRFLEFSASWCGPCQTMAPRIEQLKRLGHPVETIDIDADQQTAQRYGIKAVPTIVAIDQDGKEFARRQGAVPTNELADWFNEVRAKHHESLKPDTERGPPETQASAPNPKPWETVVRIRIVSGKHTSYGSGTIVHSTDREAIVLTCGHIFKVDGVRKQPTPDKFPGKIKIDLFDGELSNDKVPHVRYTRTLDGRAIDYDFAHDVGLIRVATDRQLPFSRVAPESFKPEAKMRVIAMGSPQGKDATMWTTTIRRPYLTNMLDSSPDYEAIECDNAPAEGRSGGGLYTFDGYVIGVCDFAEPMGNHGLYATPGSIRRILDRNQLASLYSESSSTLVATAPRSSTSEPAGEAAATSFSPANDIEATCWNIFRRAKQGPQGQQGPAGQNGKDGRDGRNGVDGKNGRDGKDGADAAGTPVDLGPIIKRLNALEAENKLPTRVRVKVPGGKIKTHYFFPPGVDQEASPKDANGEYLFRNSIGLDLSSDVFARPKQ